MAVDEALRWIVSVFERHDVPYQAVGGLAARAHGATRPIADLDFYVSAEGLARVHPEIAPYMTRPPTEHRGEDWWLTFTRLEYAGEEIELGVAEGARFRNAGSGEWEDAAVDFAAGEAMTLWDVPVRVMPRAQLISYKRRLARDVDRRDVREMLQAASGDADGA